MDFVVDKVSEDSFYINLLLGLPKHLDKYKKIGAKTKHLVRKGPVVHADICSWEQKQGILLPEDLRNFYYSTDGFHFTWTFCLGQDKTTMTGKIEINSLQNLTQIFGYETKPDPGVSEGDRFELRLGVTSKLYELVKLDNQYKIVVAYLNSRYSPTIWISVGLQEFYFLADDFTTYFRMAIIHLGIPKWQLLFTPYGVPQWIENMIRLLAPNLLEPNRTIESTRKNNERKRCSEFPEIANNKLDTCIFKCLPKISQNIPRIVEKEKLKSPRKVRHDSKIVGKLQRAKSFKKSM